MEARFFGEQSGALLQYGIRWSGLLLSWICLQLPASSLVHAGVTAAVRAAEDIDPLRTPRVYYDMSDPAIACRESGQAIIDAYITAKTGNSIRSVAYIGSDGWPGDPDADSQWKNERCEPRSPRSWTIIP